ncbi:hypothetical protein AAMO2058_000421800 [Amorphochlora amoebiformis]
MSRGLKSKRIDIEENQRDFGEEDQNLDKNPRWYRCLRSGYVTYHASKDPRRGLKRYREKADIVHRSLAALAFRPVWSSVNTKVKVARDRNGHFLRNRYSTPVPVKIPGTSRPVLRNNHIDTLIRGSGLWL